MINLLRSEVRGRAQAKEQKTFLSASLLTRIAFLPQFEADGIHLSDAARSQVVSMKETVVNLETAFQQNIVNAFVIIAGD